MKISRRTLLAAATVAPVLLARRPTEASCKIGVTDWNLNQTGKLEAVHLAKTLGFAGVQVSLGKQPVDGHLALDDKDIQKAYLDASRREGIPLDGTCLDILHVNFLKSDKLGIKWVADGIPITAKLQAKVMLLPLFGNGALTNDAEKNYVGDLLKEVAPEAEKQGVVLGLEDTISAEDNVRIMDRAQSKAVKVYYDVGNSTKNGFSVVKEIRWLGAERICQIHLKDKTYIGEGQIDFVAVMKAIEDIGYRGYANLETSNPSGSVEADMRRNLASVQRFMTEARRV